MPLMPLWNVWGWFYCTAFFIRINHRFQEPEGLELWWAQKHKPCSLENGINIQWKEKVEA